VTPNLVRAMIKRRARRAGIQVVPWASVHAWRRRFAQGALDDGVDVFSLQQLLGHASSTTTEIYARRSPDRLRQIYRRIRHRKDDEAR
jgi:site-specific recombinase XerD